MRTGRIESGSLSLSTFSSLFHFLSISFPHFILTISPSPNFNSPLIAGSEISPFLISGPSVTHRTPAAWSNSGSWFVIFSFISCKTGDGIPPHQTREWERIEWLSGPDIYFFLKRKRGLRKSERKKKMSTFSVWTPSKTRCCISRGYPPNNTFQISKNRGRGQP